MSVQTINGVDVDQLMETIHVIEDKPDIATFRFTANNRWLNGGHNKTTIGDFYGAGETHQHKKTFVFDEDEPPVLLGSDEGANPVEYVLAALAGCLTTSLVYHAAARGYEIEEVESTFQGNLDLRGFLGLDDSIRNGYEKVTVSFSIKGNLPDNVKAELVGLAQQRSPVYDMLTNGINIEVELAQSK